MKINRFSNKSLVIVVLLLMVCLIGLKFIFPDFSLTGSSTKQSFAASVEVVEPSFDSLGNKGNLAISNDSENKEDSNKSTIIISGITIDDKDSVKIIIK